MKDLTIENEGFCISTVKAQLDLEVIHKFLSEKAYWSRNIPFDKVKEAVNNSLNFGLYDREKLIGYARIISDFSTIAYLGDVFILPEYRGRGLSKWLMATIMSHPNLQGLRRWILLTGDAHGLYKQFGWTEISNPSVWMEIHDKHIYQ
jgi:N-acetylglutamate synthase-like GNAT family acetyltransferase